MNNVSQLLWAIAPSLLVGIVLATYNARQQARQAADAEERKARRRENMLNLNLTFAAAQLSYAVAMALKRGSVNGEVEEGIETYEKALKEYRLFEREQITNAKYKEC